MTSMPVLRQRDFEQPILYNLFWFTFVFLWVGRLLQFAHVISV